MARPGTRREVSFNQSRRSYQGFTSVQLANAAATMLYNTGGHEKLPEEETQYHSDGPCIRTIPGDSGGHTYALCYKGRMTVSTDIEVLQEQCAIYQAEHDAEREAQRREVFGWR